MRTQVAHSNWELGQGVGTTRKLSALGLIAAKLLPLWTWEVREGRLQGDRAVCSGHLMGLVT